MNAQFRKTAAIAGLIFVFTLGVFSLGLAQTNVTIRPIHRLALHDGFSHGLSRLTGLAWRLALDCDLPTPLTETPAVGWRVSTPLVGCGDSFIYAGPYAPKIARHLLDSVLLI